MKLRIVVLLFLLVVVGASGRAGEEEPLLVIELEDSAGGAAVVEKEINFSDLLAAVEAKGGFNPSLIHVYELTDGWKRGKAVPHQFEPAFDYDPKKGAVGALVLKLNKGGAKRLGVYLGRDPQKFAPPAETVRLRETEEEIEVGNKFFAVSHPRRANGGLPNKLVFAGSGKVDDALQLNDRLYTRELGVFALKYDSTPKVSVVAKGRIRTVVRTVARYVNSDGQSSPTSAFAVYDFCYYPDQPYFEVKVRVFQEKPFEWKELHFLELHHKQPLFPNWALGRTGLQGKFEDRQQATRGDEWGAIYDAKNLLGLICSSRVLIYDGQSGYGTYLHGPWIQWDGTRWQGRAWVYVGAGDGGYKPVQSLVDVLLAARRITLTCPPLEKVLGTASQSLEGLPKPVAALLASRLCRARKWIRRGGDFLRAEKLAETVLELSHKKVWDGLTVKGRFAVERKGKRAALASESFCLEIDGDAGAVSSLYNALTDQEFISPDSPSPIWSLLVREKSRKRETELALSSDEPAARCDVAVKWLDDDKPEISLVWKNLGAGGEKGVLDVSVSIVPDSDSRLTLWRIAVKNRSETFGLWAVRFPILSNMSCEEIADARIVYPMGWGVAVPVSDVRAYFATYPSGSCNMQFGALTAGGGVYLGAHDGEARTKQLHMSSSGAAVGLSWNHYPPDMGKASLDFELPYPVVVGVFKGNWYDAARIYRAWALKQKWCSNGSLYSRKDVPDCVKRIGLWVHRSGDPDYMLSKMLEFQERFKVPIAVHWYCWHQIPFDNDYPHYFPAKDGFREAVAKATARGILVKPYINGRLWDSDTQSFAEVGRIYCTKDESLQHYIEVYGSGEKLVPMCPHTEFWRDKVCEIVRKLVCDYGVSGVYIDQIAAAAPRLCFDEYHGHPLGGGGWWVKGYWKMLKRIRETIREKNPNAFITTEASAEPYMLYVDAYLVCQALRSHVIPLFSAVYHDRAIMFGRYILYQDYTDGMPYYAKVGQMFAAGVQLGWLGFEVLDERFSEQAEYLDRLAKCRMRALKFLAWGEMLKPLKFEKPLPVVHTVYRRIRRGREYRYEVTLDAVQSSVWRAHDGTVGLAFTNITDKPITFTFEFDAKSYGMPAAPNYRVTEISPTSTRTIATYRTPKFKRRVTIAGHDVRVLQVAATK